MLAELLAVLLFSSSTRGLDNGLALTPPMVSEQRA